MEIVIKNIDRVLESIKQGKTDFHNALIVGLREGLRRYERFAVMDMLSGRKGSYGLNVKSGIAKSSLDVEVEDLGKDITGKLTVAKRAWYLKVHQHEDFDGYIRPKQKKFLAFKVSGKYVLTKKVYIPKRLFLYEKFKSKGRSLIKSSVEAHINKI